MASVDRPRRPASVTVLAVFQLIVGGVGLIYEILMVALALTALFAPAMLKTAAAGQPRIEALTEVPIFFEALLTASLVGLVLSIVLIADGIGLLGLRRWSYNLGVLYGWLSIAYQVAWLVYLGLIALPVKLTGYENAPVPTEVVNAGVPPETYRNSLKVAEIIETGSTALGLTYPIFVLIMLAVIRKAFRRPKLALAGAQEMVAGAVPPAPAAEGPPPGYGGEPDDRIGRG